MNTRKFEVVFDHSRIINPEIELTAKVTTDVAFHYVRMRMGRVHASLWIDHGRVYTPDQEAHVRQLFAYQAPLVHRTFDRWLVAHNFPTLDELKTSKVQISAYQNAAGDVTSCSWNNGG